MSWFVLFGLLTLVLPGCQWDSRSAHQNLKVGDLKVGGEAKLVSSDGSDVILDSFVAPAAGKPGRRPTRAGKMEKVKLPVGTAVHVQEIIGDDAHVVIKDGSRAGLNCWVECLRLDPVGN